MVYDGIPQNHEQIKVLNPQYMGEIIPKNEGTVGSHGILVGGFNPSEKYARQICSLPQIVVKIKKMFETPT